MSLKKINNPKFIISATSLKNCPELNLPEIALVGRSNVGKSSFINTLTNRKKLAHTSNTPGKTRLINFYNIDEKLVIVDLPGYGYAKVSKAEQDKWNKNLEKFLKEREPLKAVIQLIDSRHEVQKNDLQMREWLDFYKIKTITIATKIDNLSKNNVQKSISSIEKSINDSVIAFSSKTGAGKDQIIDILNTFCK